MSGSERITAMLVAHRQVELGGALERLTELVYPELRRIARAQLRRWRRRRSSRHWQRRSPGVFEARRSVKVDWQDRHHYCAVARHAMRQVIIDYSSRRIRQKRGGGVHTTRTSIPMRWRWRNKPETRWHWIRRCDLDRADPRLAQLVDCRFFAGYSEEETATILAVSIRTVQRD